MNYEKEPLHISTPVPNGTYEVNVTVTEIGRAHV